MTVFHYGGSWLYIDQKIGSDKDNSYEISSKEWQLLQDLDIPSFKTIVKIKKQTNGIIFGE